MDRLSLYLLATVIATSCLHYGVHSQGKPEPGEITSMINPLQYMKLLVLQVNLNDHHMQYVVHHDNGIVYVC